MTTNAKNLASELLPCPWCGLVAFTQKQFRKEYWVQCSSGHSDGILYKTPTQAEDAWNTRAPVLRKGDAEPIGVVGDDSIMLAIKVYGEHCWSVGILQLRYPSDITLAKLANIASMMRKDDAASEPIGITERMPGAPGFTMACFKASDAPVGTKLYTTLPCTDEKADAERYRIDAISEHVK